MHLTTDLSVVLLLVYFFYAGWKKGLLRILMGPIALVVGSIVAYIYYQQTKNLAISLIIGIVGPLLIEIGLSLILKFTADAKKKEDQPIFTWGQFGGGIINLFWNGSIVALVLIFIAIVPFSVPWFEHIQTDVLHSRSFVILNQCSGNKLRSSQTSTPTAKMAANSKQAKNIQSTPEFQKLMDDPRIQALYNDPETLQEIKDKDIVKLLSNPKMQTVLQDPKLLQQFLAVNQKMMELKK